MRDKELTHAVDEWEDTSEQLTGTTQRLAIARAKILELEQQLEVLEADVEFASTKMPLSLKEAQQDFEKQEAAPPWLRLYRQYPARCQQPRIPRSKSNVQRRRHCRPSPVAVPCRVCLVRTPSKEN